MFFWYNKQLDTSNSDHLCHAINLSVETYVQLACFMDYAYCKQIYLQKKKYDERLANSLVARGCQNALVHAEGYCLIHNLPI